MDDIQNRIQSILSKWGQVYEIVESNPQLWTQNYPDLTVDQVGEVVLTIGRIFDRVRAPSGFSAGYEVAKATAISVIPNVETQIDRLISQQFNHTKSFVTQLNQLLGATLTLFVTGQSGDDDREVAALTGEIAAHAENAQKIYDGIAAKQEEIDTLSATLKEKEEVLTKLDEKVEELSGVIQTLTQTQTQAETFRDSSEESASEAETAATTLTERVKETSSLFAEAKTAKDKLEALITEASEARDTIEGLLPGAASVGLAASFEDRAKKLGPPKYAWMIVFILSILGMLGVAFTLDLQSGEIWKDALARLPFFAPLVWLAWFSAIQYGNTIRLEEDYRFKTSTAKAFVGYRDHMEHLKSVDVEHAESVLAILSARTVEVLSAPPGNTLGKSSSEASPSGGLLGMTFGKSDKDTKS